MMEFFPKIRDSLFSHTTKDTGIVLLGNALASLLAILFTVLAARSLGPESWGIVAAAGNAIIILAALGDLGIGANFFQFAAGRWETDAKKEVLKLYSISFVVRLITILVISLALLALAPLFARLIFNSSDHLLVLLTTVGFLGTLLLEFQVFVIQARKNWAVAALFIVLTNILRVLFTLLLIYTQKVNLFNVLLVFTASSVMTFVLSLIYMRVPPLLLTGWREIIERSLHFSMWMGGNKIISALASKIDILILLQLTNAYETGIYAAANRIAMGVPIVFGSFATVLAARFAALQGTKEIENFFKKSILLSVVLAFGLGMGVFIAPFIIFLFGPEYKQSVEVLQWLLVALVPFALSTPSVNVLIYSFRKPEIVTYLSFLQFPVIVIFNLIFIPKLGVFAPVLALGISNFITMVLSYIFALKYLKGARV